MDYTKQDVTALGGIIGHLSGKYETLSRRNLVLDMTRGKPSAEQLDLSDAILNSVGPGRIQEHPAYLMEELHPLHALA